jgi:Xaa-Pro dipeptidase
MTPMLADATIDGASGRIARARERLAAHGVGGAVVTAPHTIRHLTGAAPGHFPSALVLGPDEAVLVTFGSEAPGSAADRHVLLQGFHRDRHVDPEEAIAAALAPEVASLAQQAERVGVEAAVVPGWAAHGLRDLCADGRVVDVRDHLLALRRRKDADELATILRNVTLAEAAYARAADVIRPGVTELDVYHEMIRVVERKTGGHVPHIGDFTAGPGAGDTGGWPTTRPLAAGDAHVIDFQLNPGGYWADLCRTFVAGQPSPPQLDAARLAADALDAIASMLRPGVAMPEIDRAVRELLGVREDLGGGTYFHRTGHGVGVAGHEPPWIVAGSAETLEVGDVIAVEPGLYAPQLMGGIRTEDMYAITADGAERLSSFARVPFAGA